MLKSERYKWEIKFRSKNRLDGYQESFVIGTDGTTALFFARESARTYTRLRFGYLKDRPDLHREPYGWLAPQVVRVKVTLEEAIPDVL